MGNFAEDDFDEDELEPEKIDEIRQEERCKRKIIFFVVIGVLVGIGIGIGIGLLLGIPDGVSNDGSLHPNNFDPLPSWNEGVAKRNIIKFVEEVTNPLSTSYVSPDNRIAVFDLDGTLWIEKPQWLDIQFHLKDLRKKANDPKLQNESPFKEIFANDSRLAKSETVLNIPKYLETHLRAYDDISQVQYVQLAKQFLENNKHPRFQNILYKDLTYLPMIEFLQFLKQKDFKIYIVSGASAGLVRSVSEDIFGIPPENVIGSHSNMTFNATIHGPRVMRQNSSLPANLGSQKPVNIQMHIGKAPILACGNSNGDIEMLQFAQYNKPFLSCLLKHDDAGREYNYTATESVKALQEAARNNWIVISMKDDFKTVFGNVQKVTNSDPPPIRTVVGVISARFDEMAPFLIGPQVHRGIYANAPNSTVAEKQVRLVVDNFVNVTTKGRSFFHTNITNKDVVAVAADRGLVNTAIASQILINDYKVDYLIFTGIAGALTNDTNYKFMAGDVVIGERVYYHDWRLIIDDKYDPIRLHHPYKKLLDEFQYSNNKFDRNCYSGDKYEFPAFMPNDVLLSAASKVLDSKDHRHYNITMDYIASGNQLISSMDESLWIHNNVYNANVTEMEGAAAAQVACLYGIPFLDVRGISDPAYTSKSSDFRDQYRREAAENSAEVVREIISNLP